MRATVIEREIATARAKGRKKDRKKERENVQRGMPQQRMKGPVRWRVSSNDTPGIVVTQGD